MIERHIKKGVPENDIPIGEPIKSMEVKIFRRDYSQKVVYIPIEKTLTKVQIPPKKTINREVESM